jgi:UDP-N-acetylmuramate dehydrogenase
VQIHENISLLPYNTFRMDVRAERMAVLEKASDVEAWQDAYGFEDSFQRTLPAAMANPREHEPESRAPLVLGGGSNILFTRNVPGWVLKNEIRGIEVVGEDNDHVYLETGSGEPWHPFVMHCIDHGWAGLENLALIPGLTGASPMQNIGAYGVEIKDVFHELTAWHFGDQKWIRFSNADCGFGYRESVFKRALKNQFLISSVTYKLSKKPVFHVEYGAIRQELEAAGVQDLNIRAVADAVIRIRSSKLPDPAVIGNAGSFFKNPEMATEAFEHLKTKYPGIVGYPTNTGHIKVAAGWLIEKAGWKGYRKGDSGCHEKQALVLVNHGRASGQEIYALSEMILQDVKQKFGVQLEREVNIY